MTADGGATAPVHVGFDIGGTNVRGVPLRADDTVGDTVKMRRPEDPGDLVETVATLVDQIAQAEGAEVIGVGVGCAGIVDTEGVVRTSPNIPSLVQFPLKSQLDERLGLDTVVDNDATTATWAEARLGSARGAADVAFVALGTGIGTGFVLDSRLHRGTAGFAGESGHMTIVHDGLPCVCGRRGCWERYASGTAFNRLSREAAAAGRADSVLALAGGDVDDVTSEHTAQLVAEGDHEALQILAEIGYWTAVGLANLVNILDPSVIVIGGGLADIGDPLVEAIRDAYPKVMIDHDLRDPVAIERSMFGGRSGAIGAAVLSADIEP
ncbi:MAG: ROK family protein [Actinomycetota bacterium]